MRFFKLTTLLGFFSLATALNANENYNISYKISNWKNAQSQNFETAVAEQPQQPEPAKPARKAIARQATKTRYVVQQQQQQPQSTKKTNRAFSRLKNKNQEKPQTIYARMKQEPAPVTPAAPIVATNEQPSAKAQSVFSKIGSLFTRVKGEQVQQQPTHIAEATPSTTQKTASIFTKASDNTQPQRSGLLYSSKGSQDKNIDKETAQGEDEAPKSRAFSRKRYKNRYNIADAAIEKEKMEQRLEKRRAAQVKKQQPVIADNSDDQDNMNQQKIQQDLQNQQKQQKTIPQSATPPAATSRPVKANTTEKTASIYPKVFPQRYTASSGETAWTTTTTPTPKTEESNADPRFQTNTAEPFYNPVSSFLNVPALQQPQPTKQQRNTQISESDDSHPSAYYPKEKRSISTLIANNPNLSTFAQALEASGIDLQIQGEGPYTIFAPSNEAFKHLPKGAMERLMKSDNQKQLYTIIAYHVVPGKVLSKDIRTTTLKTLNGKNLNVDAARGTVTVEDAEALTADIPAANGVLYIIDEVVLPN